MATYKKRGDFQWNVQIRRKGIYVSATRTHKSDAEAWAKEIETQIDRGVYVSRVEAETTTFEQACDRYQSEVLGRLSKTNTDASRLKTLKSKLGNVVLASINSSTLAKYRDSRLEEVGAQSVIHELGLINRVLKTCQMDWAIFLPSGIPSVRKPSSPRGRDRRVTDEEIDLIKSNTESLVLGNLISLALETAMRRGELASLTWDAINFKIPAAELTKTKNGDDRNVPLSKRAVALLQSMPRNLNGRVFDLATDSITQAFERAVKRARKNYLKECTKHNLEPDKKLLVDITLHDLRHESTSRIAQRVPNLIELASITGHKDLQMLKRYYHTSASLLAAKLG